MFYISELEHFLQNLQQTHCEAIKMRSQKDEWREVREDGEAVFVPSGGGQNQVLRSINMADAYWLGHGAEAGGMPEAYCYTVDSESKGT